MEQVLLFLEMVIIRLQPVHGCIKNGHILHPDGKVLLRCYVGRPGDEAVVDLSDDEIVKIVLDDLSKTMNISMEPELAVISRWKHAMPQYTVGHKERIDRATKGLLEELPGVFMAGSLV